MAFETASYFTTMRNTLFISFLIVFTSCVKDKPQDNPNVDVQLSGAKKVYVINEGGFGYGNASVSLYDPGNGNIIEDLYKTQNSSDVGDVAQSLSYINNKFYLVVNNSGKVLVCDPDFKKITQINGIGSPRYILPVTNQKAYVSDYSSNAVSIINLNTNTKTGSILFGGWTEKMVLIYNKAFITNLRRDYVYRVNTITDTKMDSIAVGINAASIVLDKNDKVWVLSAGDKANSIAGKLSKINPVSNLVEFSVSFPGEASPGNLCLNKTKDTLYFLNDAIFRMAISETVLPANPFIAKGNRNFYGLGVNPNDNNIYAADALDYSQRSNIYIYSPVGNEKAVFKAGVNANGFYFE